MRCLAEVLDQWLKGKANAPATLETILKILRSESLNEFALATILETKFIQYHVAETAAASKQLTKPDSSAPTLDGETRHIIVISIMII